MLLSFATDYCGTANDIRLALEAQDFERAHSLVHNIKGLAGNLAATNLQAAAVNLEKLVKGIEKKAPAVKKLNLRYSELENALNHALESVQTLGIAAEEKAIGSSNEALAAIPADLVQEVTQRMRDAAQMGDVSGLNAIVEELKARSDTFTPLGNRIISLAEDFNFEGIIKLADDLDKL